MNDMDAKNSGISIWMRRYSNTAAEFHQKVIIKSSNIERYKPQRVHPRERWRAPACAHAHPQAHAQSCACVERVKYINIGVWLLPYMDLKCAAPAIINPHQF